MAEFFNEERNPTEKEDANKTDNDFSVEDTHSQVQSDATINSEDVEAQAEKPQKGDEPGAKGKGPPPEDESQFPGPRSVAMIVVAIYLAMFLVSLVSESLLRPL